MSTPLATRSSASSAGGSRLQRRRAGRHERGAHPCHSGRLLAPSRYREHVRAWQRAAYLVPLSSSCRPTPSPRDPPDPASRGEPLVPLLRVEQALGDPDALATWYSALSNALSTELPHDLLGLWLYPAHGGAVLIGPEALAQDELAVPLPAPQVEPSQMALLEDIVRDAGYASVACLPIRSGRRDVGLLLAADLRPERYGEDERLMLERVAQHLSPLMGRLSRQWGGTGAATPQVARFAALVDALAFLADMPARRRSTSPSWAGRSSRCCRTITSSCSWPTRSACARIAWGSTPADRSGPIRRSRSAASIWIWTRCSSTATPSSCPTPTRMRAGRAATSRSRSRRGRRCGRWSACGCGGRTASRRICWRAA